MSSIAETVGLNGSSVHPLEKEHTAIWIVACVGLVLSWAAMGIVRQQLVAHELLDFQWVAKNRIRAVEHGVKSGLQAVSALRDLYLVIEDVSPEDFGRFAGSVLERYEGVQSLEWVPYVPHQERRQFEARAATTYPGFRITERTSTYEIVPAQTREAYFPVLYAAPFDKGEVSIGFDFGAIPVVREVFDRARDSGMMAVSEGIHLEREPDTDQAFVAALPMYRRGEPIDTVTQRRAHLIGFAVGVFRISQVISTSIAYLEPRGVDVVVRDDSISGRGGLLHWYRSRLDASAAVQDRTLAEMEISAENMVTESFAVGDRRWTINAVLTPLFRSAEAFKEGPWTVLLVGIVFTALLSFHLARVKESVRERVLAQRALKEREELFRQMTETVDEVFWATTGDLRDVLYLSPAYQRIWGIPEAHLHKQPKLFFDAIPAEDQDRLMATMWRIKHENTDVEAIHRVLRSDGMTRWVRTRGFPVLDADGSVYRIVGFVEDITDKKLAEDALRESEQQLRAVFSQSPDIIMTVDPHGRIRMMNRSIPELPPERALGRSSLALLPSGLRKWYRPILKRVFQEGVMEHFQFSTSDSRWWEGRLVPIRADGVINSAMVIATDVTEKRVLHQQALHNARLATVGVLAASVAHEINNPNNSISFNAAILTQAWRDIAPVLQAYAKENGDFAVAGFPFSEAAESIPSLITETSRNSSRIKNIVENLKHLAKQDKGELNDAVDIGDVLKAAVMLLHNEIQKYTDVCTIEVSDDLPKVRGNAQQLEQVFINLLLNALQAIPDRRRSVHIDAKVDDTHEQVVMVVRDEGCGISERELGRVTEPFFTTKMETGGTGLGLSISKSIIDSHNGSMRFASELGKGTTVTVEIPIYKAAA